MKEPYSSPEIEVLTIFPERGLAVSSTLNNYTDSGYENADE